MKNFIINLKKQAEEEIKNSSKLDLLEKIEKKYLGRKNGELTNILKKLKDLSLEEKKVIGKLANEMKQELEKKIEDQKLILKQSNNAEAKEFDITLPGEKLEIGHLHPLTQFIGKITKIFTSMGFEVIEGSEVETEKYNFDLLNVPANHPSRDAWDTFYIEDKSKKDKLLLRTQTSPVQLRVMGRRGPPIRLISPGRVFRHEATDASHETTFYQLEGLVIDKNIKMTDLIGVLDDFIKAVFGSEIKIRVRPSFFPFTEPSIELDMNCLICMGKGCSVCGGGWIETIGAGMVHPSVFKNMKIDSDKYSGFAFGMGVDRLMMLYYGINDVRLSHSGDLRFIRQL